MALTKEERDALPADQFAFPRTRQCPMPDEKHTKMAWDMVDTTKGVTDEERAAARKHVLRRAKELGMDTSGWATMKAMSVDVDLEAMSLEMPTEAHPNKMPFKGVLVVLDQPSNKPPHGSGNRKVIMTTEAAQKAIPTLLGMGVNYTPKMDGHDAQKKIGIISEAEVKDGEIQIAGFIYASDFPDAAARIRADKKLLGFSFEAKVLKLADPGADPLEIEECVFTGAAILRKDKAAFSSTSLAAHAEEQPQEIEMTKEEIAAAIADAMGTALKPVTDRLGQIEAAQAKTPALMAKAQTEGMVEPHAKGLEACADGMEAAGIGGHPTRGHVAIMRNMAKTMRASAAMGQLPHVYRDHDFFTASAAEGTSAADITKAVQDAVKPLQDKIDAQGTVITDLKAKAFNAAAAPARATFTPEVIQLLAKAGLEKDAEEGKLTVQQVDTMLDAQGVTGAKRIETKLKLQASGALKAA